MAVTRSHAYGLAHVGTVARRVRTVCAIPSSDGAYAGEHMSVPQQLNLIDVRRFLTPQSGLLGQGMRYALAGSFVALVYLLTTTFLAVVVGMPFTEALPIGFALQLAVHFTLQRVFVWVHDEEFALPFRHQARRYLLVAGMQLGVTIASTSVLPPVLHLSSEIVYLLTVALLTIANFLLFRNVVFHPGQTEDRLDA
jgi:putative flippase GtrA